MAPFQPSSETSQLALRVNGARGFLGRRSCVARWSSIRHKLSSNRTGRLPPHLALPSQHSVKDPHETVDLLQDELCHVAGCVKKLPSASEPLFLQVRVAQPSFRLANCVFKGGGGPAECKSVLLFVEVASADRRNIEPWST